MKPMYTIEVPDPEMFHVYVHRAAGGAVLYVGYSAGLFARQGQHARVAPWWNRVVSIDVYEFATKGEAIAFEAEMIATLKPPQNTRGVNWATREQYAMALERVA